MLDHVTRIEREGKEAYKLARPYLVTVPHGRRGPWSVEQFDVSVDNNPIGYFRCWRDGRAPGIGAFTKLVHEQRGVVMSDTIPEITDVLPYLKHLKGHVLITGLGLGMVPNILLKHPEYSKHVKSITIIEKDADVIALTGQYYLKQHSRITIIKADAMRWKPKDGRKFDVAWHDIWDEISAANNFKAIKRRFAHFIKGRQFCWGEAYVKENML